MSTEQKKIDEELSAVVTHHKEFLVYQLGVEYVEQGEIFEKLFRSLDSTVCSDCGDEFRITHFCDVVNERIWKKNWKTELRKLLR